MNLNSTTMLLRTTTSLSEYTKVLKIRSNQLLRYYQTLEMSMAVKMTMKKR